MIIANITDREHYYSLHPKMKQLWDYILTHDLANSPTGRINIDGDRLFVNVDDSEMSPKEECPLEVHRRYIDVQIPLTHQRPWGGKPSPTSQHPVSLLSTRNTTSPSLQSQHKHTSQCIQDSFMLCSQKMHTPPSLALEG